MCVSLCARVLRVALRCDWIWRLSQLTWPQARKVRGHVPINSYAQCFDKFKRTCIELPIYAEDWIGFPKKSTKGCHEFRLQPNNLKFVPLTSKEVHQWILLVISVEYLRQARVSHEQCHYFNDGRIQHVSRTKYMCSHHVCEYVCMFVSESLFQTGQLYLVRGCLARLLCVFPAQRTWCKESKVSRLA